MSLLYAADGVTPLERTYHEPEVPADILEGLRRIDPKLGLRWSPTTRDNLTGEIGTHGHWMITYEWPESDRRWEMVRRQEIARADALDAIGHLPPDCDATQAVGYFVATVQRFRDKETVTQLLSRVEHFNRKREEEVMQPVLDYADELIAERTPTLFGFLGKTIGKVRFGRGLARAAKDGDA
jgi:hypothetical protein